MVCAYQLVPQTIGLMKTDDTLNLGNNTEEAKSASVFAPEEIGTTATESPSTQSPSIEDVYGMDKKGELGADEGASEEGKGEGVESGEQETPAKKPRSIIRELIETVAIVLVVFLTVRFLVQNFVVEGDSMLPTLHNEQYLLVNKVAYGIGSPTRGDIVVFLSPTEPKDFIKRVIGLAGETVEVKPDPDPTGRPGSPCGDCGVYINGVHLDEPYIKQTPDYSYGPITIPQGYVFVMGDNRRNSQDSHSFGPLNVNAIIGTAFLSYWPFDKLGFLSHPSYPNIAAAPAVTLTPTVQP